MSLGNLMKPRPRITVDTMSAVRTIPRNLFGANVAWAFNAGDAYGVFDGKPQWNPEIVALAKQAGVSCIRFPGGTPSDCYHWQDAVGPFASRKRIKEYPDDKDVQDATVGTDEIIDLCNLIGASLLLTVNVGTGTAQEAADWVRFVGKRVAAGVSWELGNELYHADDASGAAMSPETYRDKAGEMLGAMVKVDPALQLWLIGGKNQGRYQFISYVDWNDRVFPSGTFRTAMHGAYAPVGDRLDSAIRQAPLPPWPPTADDVNAAYRAMLAFPLLLAQNLRDIGGRIAVTEWGPVFAMSPDSPMLDHPKTLAGACYTALAIQTFIESANVDAAHFFKLCDPLYMGLIGFNGQTPKARASMLAFGMFKAFAGATLLKTALANVPTYDSKDFGWCSAVKGVPMLSAVSCKTAKGVSLVVVNKSLTAAIEADVFGLTGNAKVRTLTGRWPDSHTGTELAPYAQWAVQASSDSTPFAAKGDAHVEEKTLAMNGTVRYSFPKHSVTLIEVGG